MINIGGLKQGDTIVFCNCATALVCNVIHDKNDKNSWRGDYVVHFYVNHHNSSRFEFNSKYYFSDGTYRSNYEDWTPHQFESWFITEIRTGRE